MPADFRQMRYILEGTGTSKRRALIVTDEEYYAAFPTATDDTSTPAHPWTNQNEPRWFAAGSDTSNPPVKVWERVPAPTSAEAGTDNVTIVYRPLMGLLTSDQYNELSASTREATNEHIRFKYLLGRKQYEAAAAHRQAREDELHALRQNDMKESEQPLALRIPDSAESELGMYE